MVSKKQAVAAVVDVVVLGFKWERVWTTGRANVAVVLGLK